MKVKEEQNESRAKHGTCGISFTKAGIITLRSTAWVT